MGYTIGSTMVGSGWRCSCGIWVTSGQLHECPVVPSRTNPAPTTVILGGPIMAQPIVLCARCNRPLVTQYRYGVPGPVTLVVEPHDCPEG